MTSIENFVDKGSMLESDSPLVGKPVKLFSCVMGHFSDDMHFNMSDDPTSSVKALKKDD